jgi:formate hydrogenlyase transcriptional activator
MSAANTAFDYSIIEETWPGVEIHLASGIASEPAVEGIIGRSQKLRQVLTQVATVAPTSATVLIQGETGTGKEMIARAIHNLSDRSDRPFITLNCAAIPSGLLESELFGHERGAFTSAIGQKIGRFELANKGTLFLDEIGELPLELQAKFLRVLQEQEFERVGSSRTQRVDVRVVAATNCDLASMARSRRFRPDLYYRLNVFPICLPALRERREDIPMLVRHFVQHYSARMKKDLPVIPPQVMEALTQHSWPGNIRELQNFIERSVILSTGSVLRAPLNDLRQMTVSTEQHEPNPMDSTLRQAEREHILHVLDETGWVIGGRNGAAERLGVPRTTLIYMLRRLAINRPGNVSSPAAPLPFCPLEHVHG